MSGALKSTKIISVVGAGGKTTLIKRMAEKYRAEGKIVLVLTTTHMLREEYTDVSCNPDVITDRLLSEGFCMAGKLVDIIQEEPEKIGPLSEDILGLIIPHADIVLVEADGARRHSLKYPAEHEPVIFSGTDEIIIVMGLWDIGRDAGECVHRWSACGGKPCTVTMDMIKEELIGAYLKKFEQAGYSGKITCLFSSKSEEGLTYLTSEMF